MAETELKYVKVHTLSNRFEADVITEALRQEGIPVLLRSFEETAYTTLFTPQKGWGRIMVPKEMADQAREIISSLALENESNNLPSAGDWQIDSRFWDKLRQADPQEVVSRAGVEYHPEDNVYVVPFLNTAVLCYPETEVIEAPGSLAGFSEDFQLNGVLVHYLLAARNKPLANKWVSEKDLPGGSLFFTASHTLPLEALSDAFDERPQLLDAAARSIGGEKTDLGGMAYRFTVLPRIPILIIFWVRDEEFGPSFHILFDETITEHLNSLDLVWGLANVFARVLLDCAASVSESIQEG
ncbi:MAG: DUF3786 domain-containing protein [Syntrophobacteraceae bacterium]